MDIEKAFESFDEENREPIIDLLSKLKNYISDDYRCTDDSEDTDPGMTVTFGIDRAVTKWNYQTGDNSFTGGAYSFPHWAVISLYRNSDPEEMYDDIMRQWSDCFY